MTTITDIAATAATRFDMDQDAAENAAREYLCQVEIYDGVSYDEDEIPTEVADFILGSIKAGIDATPPTALDDVTYYAGQIHDQQQEITDLSGHRDRAILAAAENGFTHEQIAAAAGLSMPRIKQVLATQRKVAR